MALKLNIIIGSVREGRVGPKIAKWFDEFARTHGKFDVELVDLADFGLPLLDEPKHPRLRQYEHDYTKRWSASVAGADAYAFVTPEYDYFAPAALINAIQFLFNEWQYKPAGIVSYGGVSGGLRSSQMLKLQLTSLNVMPISQGVPVPFFSQFIGEDGVFRPNQQMTDGADGMLNDLHRWAVALKPMREPKPAP